MAFLKAFRKAFYPAVTVSLLTLSLPAFAQTSPADSARNAITALQEAATELRAAEGARDRVTALTLTVRAYEAGLDAMREGLRRATIREASIRGVFEAERDRLASLLGVLQSIEASPAPITLLHPSGPVGAARSAMIMAQVAPALQKEAENIRLTLEEVEVLRSLQQSAVDVLEDGLSGAQDARAALSLAISERRDLPRRFFADEAQMQALISSTETLESFASGLMSVDLIPGTADTGQIIGFAEQKGHLDLPVLGRVLRSYLEADAAGITRPGLILATRPLSLVTLPIPATIRYSGPLLDYGQVAIVEPGEGYLIVMAGMGQVFGEVGEVLAQGAPIGMMGGQAANAQAYLMDQGQGNGADSTETLYIEIRESGTPVDPGIWFALNGE
ncbi:MAG: peptidoglycan DD-metalloendopeptidase family protein [Rhodobacteraceae bacterium]|nr:peptidoglycan DD-metalloendopeptidase family protein [Paracoccaceae bacterium]